MSNTRNNLGDHEKADILTENQGNKVVVIAGASSGLGEALARHLAAQGARLVLGARRLERLQALARSLGLPEAAVVGTDVTRPEQVQALVDRAVALYGRIDVMVNNAGLMPHSLLERRRIEDWDAMIDVNLKGVLYGIAAALPYMKQQQRGHIRWPDTKSAPAARFMRPPRPRSG